MAKIKVKKTKKEEDIYNLTGEQSALLAEACALDLEKKEAEARLKEIKEKLNLPEKGTYKNTNGDSVVVNFRDNYTDIDPKEFHAEMKKKRLVKFFWKSIKVGLTEAKKYLSEKEINDLRVPLEPIKTVSFKQKE